MVISSPRRLSVWVNEVFEVKTFEFLPKSELYPTISRFHGFPFFVFGQSRKDQQFSLILKLKIELIRNPQATPTGFLLILQKFKPIRIFWFFSIHIIESKAFLSCRWLRLILKQKTRVVIWPKCIWSNKNAIMYTLLLIFSSSSLQRLYKSVLGSSQIDLITNFRLTIFISHWL